MSFFGIGRPSQKELELANEISDLKNEIVQLKEENLAQSQKITSLICKFEAPIGTEDALQHFIEHANVPICGIDLNGRVNEFNRKGIELLKIAKQQVLGEDFFQAFAKSMDETSKDSLRTLLQDALNAKETQDTEFCTLDGDGQTVDMLLNCTTRRDFNGKIIGVLAVGQDITLRKRAEQINMRLAKELRSFIDTANAPIFGIDAEGKVNEWNNKAIEITGFTAEDIMGKDLVEEFIMDENKKAVRELMDNAMIGLLGVFRCDLVCLCLRVL